MNLTQQIRRRNPQGPVRPWEGAQGFPRTSGCYAALREMHAKHGYQDRCRLHWASMAGTFPGTCVPGLVYFLLCEGRAKIGATTKTIEDRVAVMQKHWRRTDLTVLATRPVWCWRAAEATAHLLAEPDHVAGEWFTDGPAFRAAMASALDGYVVQ